jgi:nucleoside-diphosphate-sugar epimerase
MNHVVFNGQTGGLGRYLAAALKTASLPGAALTARLEDAAGIDAELDALQLSPQDQLTLIPLAGLVPVVVCEKEPERARKTNVTDTVALVSQLRTWARRNNAVARVLYVSSGHVYAPQAAPHKLIETDAVLPRSVYARTKLEAERELQNLFQDDPDNFLVARVFGLLSPEQPLPYVLPSLIKRAREKNFSNMGGLDCVRDYLDARDVCRVLAALAGRDWKTLARPSNNVFNVSSGEGTSIRDLFSLVLKTAGVTPAEAEQRMTLAPARLDDIAWMVGNPSALASQIKVPLRSIPLQQTVQEAFQSQ